MSALQQEEDDETPYSEEIWVRETSSEASFVFSSCAKDQNTKAD